MPKVTVLLLATIVFATMATAKDVQTRSQRVFLTATSAVEPQTILKSLQHECPNVTISSDGGRTDYTFEVTHSHGFPFTIADREKSFRGFAYSLTDAVRTVCHLINNGVTVEVMSNTTFTQSLDARDAGGIINAVAGRRTSTDSSSIYVIVNGEHALLDCYEHRTGCSTIGPGKYFGELKEGSLWVDYEMPLTHKPTRNHYKVAGSW